MQALASTSADARLPQDPICRDEAILRRAESDPWPLVHTPQQGWMALLGDADGDALFDHPDGLDALSFDPPLGAVPLTIYDLVFSTDRDGLGFTDGDVLRLDPNGGFTLVHAEADLLAALHVPGANLDIDALAVLDSTTLRFSLRDGLSSTVLGDLEDGDILEWEPATGVVALVAAESQVQAWVDAATGGTNPIGDLKSLSFLQGTSEMVFTVQSPTASDATVYREGSGGQILSGWEEGDWQFQTSTELDALCFIPDSMVQPILLTTDVHYLAPNTDFQVRLRHAEVGEQFHGMVGPNFHVLGSSRGGVGYTVLDPTAAPLVRWPGSQSLPLIADGSGVAETKLRTPALPAGIAFAELWYQVHGSERGWSTPLVIRVE
ncbi:MAG: hypothetical protein ACYTEP_09115 [Planctomycetota bacterium]